MKIITAIIFILIFLPVGCSLVVLNKEKPGYEQAEKECLAKAHGEASGPWYVPSAGWGGAVVAVQQNNIFNACMKEKDFTK